LSSYHVDDFRVAILAQLHVRLVLCFHCQLAAGGILLLGRVCICDHTVHVISYKPLAGISSIVYGYSWGQELITLRKQKVTATTYALPLDCLPLMTV